MTYQEWYKDFSRTCMSPDYLSANTFGLIVWERKQEEIDFIKDYALSIWVNEKMWDEMEKELKESKNGN